MRVFRQTTRGDWSNVMWRVAQELSERVAALRRLREAEDEEEDRAAGREHRPDARRPEDGRRGGGEQIDAAPDDVVQREADDLPAGDFAPEAGGLTHVRAVSRLL